jgi:hypothetical protein
MFGGFNIAPGAFSPSTYYQGICLMNCPGINGTTYNLFQNGQTRLRKVEILTVNGVADANAANNSALLPITKIACTTASVDGIELTEEPRIKIFTITGRPVRGAKTIEELPTGMYIIHMIYKDHTEVTKFAK